MPPTMSTIWHLWALITMMEMVWFFIHEHHGTPRECSECHSSVDFKFVCCLSISTYNNFYNHMTPFNVDKLRLIVAVKVGVKTFSLLFHGFHG
jgi:hypothetical protein